MTISLAFWITMLICFLGGGFYYRSNPTMLGFGGVGFFLMFLIGIAVFGWPIKG